ncbi:MAG: hypothetical protein HZC55_04885 [Verrucomicrobia bacterium]|nr:hypothetical protein [Verrucomicrobiota bacterium]
MSPRVLNAALALCLFLIIATAKWATFDRWGSPMPDWDQWDAEAGELLSPWYGKDNFVRHLFHPHNEHRVILTKLHNLSLTVLNGQWDSRLEAVTNAMLHAAIAAALWLAAARWVSRAWLAPLFLLLVGLFAPPVAWQNVLGGFHSQQYWLVGLSFLTIATLPFHRPGSRGWWLGAFAAILVLGSMGSGLLAAATVSAVVAWRLLRREIPGRQAWPTLALACVLIAVGFAARIEVDWHQHMKARSVHDFVFSMLHSLQWPWRERNWYALVLWLPWLLTLAHVLASPRPAGPSGAGEATAAPASSRAGPVLAALGGWVVLQIAATAYARGAGADYPASRYMDTLSFGVAINGLALAWLHSSTTQTKARLGLGIFALGWLLVLGFGLHPQLDGTFRIELPDAVKYYRKAEGHLRRYLATDDPRQLAYPDIPYPSAQGLIDRLADPHLRALMPVPVRPPLTVAPQIAGDSPFRDNDARTADPNRPPRHGLSPATPPLDFAPTWGSHGAPEAGGTPTGEWRSQPLPPPGRGSRLIFETAGHLGQPGLALELRAAADDALLATVTPSRLPGDAWRSAQVAAPSVPYRIVARDQDPSRWFAFSGPVVMGPLSYCAWQATKHGLLLLQITVGITLALAAYALLGPRRGAKADRPAA